MVNLTDPSIVARHVELDVIELGGGMSVIKTVSSDASGHFRIEGLPEDQRLMIRANYKGANYHAQVAFTAGKAQVEIGIYEPTTSTKDVQVDSDTIAFQLVGDQLKTLETVTLDNKTKPPRTFTRPEGNFRIAKPSGIIEPPTLRVTAPGSSMALVQSALESADGKSYYSLYPLKPGVTKFEVELLLPYAKRSYTYTKKFYQDVGSVDVGVIPEDLALSGKGLKKLQADSQKNFSVYASAPIKAGTEVVWQLSGGTAVPETASPQAETPDTSQADVRSMPNVIGRNALVIGPLLLMGFVLVLWYAFNRTDSSASASADFRLRQIRARRDELLDFVADLDHRHETQALGEQEFARQREESKRRLRRIALLLKKP